MISQEHKNSLPAYLRGCGATGQDRLLRKMRAVLIVVLKVCVPICGADVRFLHHGLRRPPCPQRCCEFPGLCSLQARRPRPPRRISLRTLSMSRPQAVMSFICTKRALGKVSLQKHCNIFIRKYNFAKIKGSYSSTL